MHKLFAKIVSLTLISALALSGSAGLVSAQDGLLFGQKHFYTVVFRGNGEAVVYAKMVITNPSESPLTDFSFEMPGAYPSEIVMYQVDLPRVCVRWDHRGPPQTCLEYRDPDYTERYHYLLRARQAEYKKIQHTRSENLYSFALPVRVEPFKSTAIIVAYTTKDYVNESFGLYRFNFETLTVPSRIQAIRVAIDVDSDLLLKGKKAAVDYGGVDLRAGNFASPQSVSSRDLDRIAMDIGFNGPLIKEAKNLAPNESFNVKGEYATSWLRLYLDSILLAALVIAGILGGIYFLAKLLLRRGGRGEQPGGTTNQQETLRTPQSSIGLQNSFSVFNLTNALVGLLSAGMVVVLTYAVYFMFESELLRSLNIDPDISPAFGIIGLIAAIILYALVVLGPAVIVATKHGWMSFVSILIAVIVWFAVFFVIYLALFQPGKAPNVSEPRPYPGFDIQPMLRVD